MKQNRRNNSNNKLKYDIQRIKKGNKKLKTAIKISEK